MTGRFLSESGEPLRAAQPDALESGLPRHAEPVYRVIHRISLSRPCVQVVPVLLYLDARRRAAVHLTSVRLSGRGDVSGGYARAQPCSPDRHGKTCRPRREREGPSRYRCSTWGKSSDTPQVAPTEGEGRWSIYAAWQESPSVGATPATDRN